MQKMEHQSKNRLTSLCFFAMGFWMSVLVFTISWIATEDLLAGTTWSTTIVLIGFSVPELFSKVLSPIIVRRIPFLCSMIVLTVMLAGSLLIIVLVEDVTLRIIGVGFLGNAYGFGLVTCYQMLAYYDNAEDLASTFKFGINMSTFFASLGYTERDIESRDFVA
ncbi:hypothetical protein QZH41_005353 [Actinostola sp. cb2023]|nr:hypothetical protein QZH41_005353 [Actinostola sp. cb2023]